MRKNGRGHWDDDEDPYPVLSTVFAVVAPAVLALIVWWGGG